MTATSVTGLRDLLGHKPFLFYASGRVFSQLSYQITAVAVGWQIYDMTNSPLYLGLAGLVQFLPTLILIFVGGHVADRYERNRIVQICQTIEGTTAAYLAWGVLGGWLTVPELFIALTVFGIAKAFENPAAAALLPSIVSRDMLQRSTALASGAGQMATICGPALGGLAYAYSPGTPYIMMTVFWIAASLLNGAIRIEQRVTARPPATLSDVFAGIAFVKNNPAILGTISLDLFAVLLGGATALLPIYARDILQAGPWALGILRAAPAVGALLTTFVIARFPITRRVGMRMFQAVIIFGLATIVFSLSQWIWLSIIALMIMGAADMVSVVIRVSLVQLATPDEMRGRVSAVNFLFINASNQLGEFESGATAALFGPVLAALLGGVGTVFIALLWMRLFPTLRDVEELK